MMNANQDAPMRDWLMAASFGNGLQPEINPEDLPEIIEVVKAIAPLGETREVAFARDFVL